MGNDFSYGHLKGEPDSRLESKYDPLYGFPKGRKVREMVATEAEMDSAMVPFRFRDYCAHMYIKLMACRNENSPWFNRCKHEHHAWLTCLYEDELMRIKEWEREKRLDQRQKRIKDRMKKEGLEIPSNA